MLRIMVCSIIKHRMKHRRKPFSKNNEKIYKSFFENQKKDKINVLFSNPEKVFAKKTCFVSIIEIYGLATKKIIFILLR